MARDVWDDLAARMRAGRADGPVVDPRATQSHLDLAQAMLEVTLGTVCVETEQAAGDDQVVRFELLLRGLIGPATESPVALTSVLAVALMALRDSGRVVDMEGAYAYLVEHAKRRNLPLPPTMPPTMPPGRRATG